MDANLFLLQMAGRSGVGKSTLATRIGQKTGAVVLDMDVVKSSALDAGAEWDTAGRVAYTAVRSLAKALLRQGFSVILDSPCRFQQIVDEGTAVAQECGAVYAYIECTLDDNADLRRRLQRRTRQRSQVPDLDVPPVDAPGNAPAATVVVASLYKSMYPTTQWLRVDTGQPLERCLDLAMAYLRQVTRCDVVGHVECPT